MYNIWDTWSIQMPDPIEHKTKLCQSEQVQWWVLVNSLENCHKCLNITSFSFFKNAMRCGTWYCLLKRGGMTLLFFKENNAHNSRFIMAHSLWLTYGKVVKCWVTRLTLTHSDTSAVRWCTRWWKIITKLMMLLATVQCYFQARHLIVETSSI